jgi:uncharacterized protein
VGVSRIFWDTNLFIYLLEGSGEKFPVVRHLLERMIERRDELLTSSLTLGEVLVKPLEMDRPDLVDRYERLLNSPGVSLIPFDDRSARIYARMRQTVESARLSHSTCGRGMPRPYKCV